MDLSYLQSLLQIEEAKLINFPAITEENENEYRIILENIKDLKKKIDLLP